MQKNKRFLFPPLSNLSLLFAPVLIFILLFSGSSANAFEYPYKLIIVDKSKASYATPEEALAANFSALLHKDLDWYYQTMTSKTAEEDKKLFQEAGIGLEKNFDLVNENDETFILENRTYKTGVLLIAVSRRPDGFVMRGSVPLVRVNGQWKLTSEFGRDPDLDQYDDLVLPSQLITPSPFSARLYPEELDLGWYNKVKGQQADKTEVVCVLQGVKQADGEVLPVTEIATASLYLNDLVPYTPWSLSKNEPIEVVVLAAPTDYVPGDFKSFHSWWKKANIPFSPENPVMLVKFNQYRVMQSIANPIPGKEYELSITGRLKDEDDRPFKSTARIKLSAATSRPGKE